MKRWRGFSLIEISLSIFLVSLSVLIVMNLFTVGRRGLAQNDARTQASILARAVLDEQRERGFDGVVASSNNSITFNVTRDGVPSTMVYTYDVGIATRTDEKEITVTVRWNDASGRNKSLRMSTLLVDLE